MPTVLRFGAFRVVIYPNDHFPAHVHVIGQGHEAVFALNCPAGPAALRERYGFALRDVTKIEAVLNENITPLCEAWRTIHGIG
jgi:hypothetical protein